MSRIIRWNPVRQPSVFDFTFDRAMNRMFDETWRSFFNEDESIAKLAMDLSEVDNAYHLKTDLPGVDAEHIDIRIEDDTLTITAEIPETVVEQENKDHRVLVRERRYGKFSRTVRLPHPVDTDNIDAVYNNGVLELTMPKLPELQPKQIAVKATNGNGQKK